MVSSLTDMIEEDVAREHRWVGRVEPVQAPVDGRVGDADGGHDGSGPPVFGHGSVAHQPGIRQRQRGSATRILPDAMTQPTSEPGRSSSLRLGVAGLGAVAQSVHLPLLARLPDRFCISAVCDLSRSTRDAVGARYGVPVPSRHETLDEMLAGSTLDGLVILTSGSHAAAAGLGLEAGLAVLCEKPLAFTLAEVDQLSAIQERTGGRLLLGYMKLYDPAVREARRSPRLTRTRRSVANSGLCR